jgi:hypothetical protein
MESRTLRDSLLLERSDKQRHDQRQVVALVERWQQHAVFIACSSLGGCARSRHLGTATVRDHASSPDELNYRYQ